MAPKGAKRMVVRSTTKVVQESVQLSVLDSGKRLTRGNREIEIDEDVGSTLRQEQVRIIPFKK